MKAKRSPYSQAFVALCVQCLALLVVWACSALWNMSTHQNLPTDVLFFMQAVCACLLACLVMKDYWWRYIQLVFPLAICIALRFDIPRDVFLVGFLLSISIFWTCFKTQVPFYPSHRGIRDQIASLIPDNRFARFIDIGSGIGDLSLTLAQQKPAALIFGIEIAPLPWLISVIRARLKKSKAIFKFGNYQHLDFATYDIVFAYLSPAAMDALGIKAQAEMRKKSLLISHEFPIPSMHPIKTLRNAMQTKETYVYRM
jgi:hypothetical protein